MIRSPPEHFTIGYVDNDNLPLGNIIVTICHSKTIAGTDGVFWRFSALFEDQFFFFYSPKLSCGFNSTREHLKPVELDTGCIKGTSGFAFCNVHARTKFFAPPPPPPPPPNENPGSAPNNDHVTNSSETVPSSLKYNAPTGYFCSFTNHIGSVRNEEETSFKLHLI